MMKENLNNIEHLIFTFFNLCKLEPKEIHPGIWQVEADEGLMKELDGYRAQARLLQFTFRQDLAEAFGADLICRGSYRFNSILAVIEKQAILSQAHVPHHFFYEPNIRQKIIANTDAQRAYVVNHTKEYCQYLELQFLATTSGLQTKERVHQCTVNLSSGAVLKFTIPPKLIKSGGVENERIKNRKYSFKRAFTLASNQVNQEIEKSDLTWAQEAKNHLEQEEAKLKEYFSGNLDSPEFKAKQNELQQNLSPRLRLAILRGAIIYIPLFSYRLVLIARNGKETIKNVVYDPISNLELSN